MKNAPSLAAKRLQFLRELAAQLARVAVLWNPNHWVSGGRSLGVRRRTLVPPD
jgi:hypothetical protein